MTSTNLAIDLAEYNSVLCWYEPVSRSAAYLTIRTDREQLRQELTRRAAARVQKGVQPESQSSISFNSVGHESGSASWTTERGRRPAHRLHSQAAPPVGSHPSA